VTPAAIFTLAVIALAVLLIVKDVAPPDAMLFSALVVFMAAGVVTPEQGLAGFGNPAVATVGALFIVAAGMRSTGVLENASRAVLGSGNRIGRALLRLTASSAFLSAFLANTPVVAMGVPTVTAWAKRNHVSPSRLLIPLSYASLLGGICTLIGTSTNLVSHGLLQRAGMPGFGFFELAAIGVPCALIGIAYLTRVAPRLLTDRIPIRTVGEDVRRYLVEMRLTDPSPLIGKTIVEAGLRHLPGLFLVRVERSTGIISPVGPDVRLLSGDLLTFAGVVESIVDLRSFDGLTPTASSRPPDTTRVAGISTRPSFHRDRRLWARTFATPPSVGDTMRRCSPCTGTASESTVGLATSSCDRATPFSSRRLRPSRERSGIRRTFTS
jgi:di/tricarboxylate transporter